MPSLISCYSSNLSIRSTARLQLIQDFRSKAIARDEAFIHDALHNEKLFIHELSNEDLRDFIAFAGKYMTPDDLVDWLTNKVIWALIDQNFEKAGILMSAASRPMILVVEDLRLITPELLDFLESHTAHFTLNPFLNINWSYGAGYEEFIRLHKISGAKPLKQFILRDDWYDPDEGTYGALGVSGLHGLLADFLDQETINLVIARGFIQFLWRNPEESALKDLISKFESGQLMEVLATEARLGNRDRADEALKTITPYLATASA